MIKSEGRTLFAFDSVQANFIAKKLAINLLQKEKMESQSKLHENLNREIIEKDKVLNTQQNENSILKNISDLQVKQIEQYKIQLNAYKKSDVRAKLGRLFYKSLAFALGFTTIYFSLKK